MTAGQARRFPLLRDPVGTAQGRLVGTGEADGNGEVFGDLLNQGGFTDLTCAGHHLDVSPRFPESAGELGSLRSPKRFCRFAH